MARKGENIRKRQDGRWEARLITGYDYKGKAQYKYLYGKTYAEAKNKKYQYFLNHDDVKDKKTKSGFTFHQLLTDWLFYIKSDIKESTYARYVFCIQKHIEPELGKVPLCNLTTEIIEQFKRNKLEHGKLTGKGGLSPKTVTDLLSIIKIVLEFGVEHDYDCSEHIIIHYPKQRNPQIQILDIHDQEYLKNYLMTDTKPYMIGIMISLYAGLRLGEICALRWDDISFSNKLLNVDKTIMRIQNTEPNAQKKTKIIIERPKTACSIRKIPLSDYFLSWLEQYRKAPEIYIVTGSSYYIEPRNYYLKYKKLMKKCSLEQYNYHALRHTFATRCVEHDFDIKSLSEILGHSDVSTTMKRYVHPSLDLKRKHMQKLCSQSFCSQNCSQ